MDESTEHKRHEKLAADTFRKVKTGRREEAAQSLAGLGPDLLPTASILITGTLSFSRLSRFLLGSGCIALIVVPGVLTALCMDLLFTYPLRFPETLKPISAILLYLGIGVAELFATGGVISAVNRLQEIRFHVTTWDRCMAIVQDVLLKLDAPARDLVPVLMAFTACEYCERASANTGPAIDRLIALLPLLTQEDVDTFDEGVIERLDSLVNSVFTRIIERSEEALQSAIKRTGTDEQAANLGTLLLEVRRLERQATNIEEILGVFEGSLATIESVPEMWQPVVTKAREVIPEIVLRRNLQSQSHVLLRAAEQANDAAASQLLRSAKSNQDEAPQQLLRPGNLDQ